MTAADVHDSRMLVPMLDAVVPIRTGRCGRPRCRPEKLDADKGYDYRRCRDACVERGIKHRIARKGVESKEKLGRAMRRAFLHLACALICWNYLQRL